MIPSLEDYGTHGRSLYRELWDGCTAAFCPSLGPTGGQLINFADPSNPAVLTNMDPATDWIVHTGQYALDIDATNDFAVAANYATSYPISICGWARAASVGAKWAMVLTNQADTEMRLGCYFSNGISTMAAYNTSGNNQATTTSYATSNLWTHFAVVFESATLRRVYGDGRQRASSTASVNISGDMSKLLIGTLDETSTTCFGGQVDDLRVYNRVLSDGEIRTLAMSRGIPYERRKIRYFSFESDSSPPPAAASYKPRKTFSRVVP